MNTTLKSVGEFGGSWRRRRADFCSLCLRLVKTLCGNRGDDKKNNKNRLSDAFGLHVLTALVALFFVWEQANYDGTQLWHVWTKCELSDGWRLLATVNQMRYDFEPSDHAFYTVSTLYPDGTDVWIEN